MGYPVFTGSTICSHAYCHILHLGLPVQVGGLTIRQGDLLHGDADGVTEIPSAMADEIADVAPEFVAAERIVLDYVQGSGPKTVAGLSEVRKEFAAAMARLTARVARTG